MFIVFNSRKAPQGYFHELPELENGCTAVEFDEAAAITYTVDTYIPDHNGDLVLTQAPKTSLIKNGDVTDYQALMNAIAISKLAANPSFNTVVISGLDDPVMDFDKEASSPNVTYTTDGTIVPAGSFVITELYQAGQQVSSVLVEAPYDGLDIEVSADSGNDFTPAVSGVASNVGVSGQVVCVKFINNTGAPIILGQFEVYY